MAYKNLEEKLKAAGNPVKMLRNSQIGAYVYPVVAPEFTNWRDEQRAWRETCVLFDQSHHMVDLFVEAPDALKLISHLAINTFKNFTVDKAKQFAPVHSVRPRHRRRHPVLSRREQVRVRRPRTDGQLDPVPRRDRRLRRRDHEGRPLAVAPRGQAGHPSSLSLSRSRARTPKAVIEKLTAAPSRTSSSSTWATINDRRPQECARCVTAWPARRASRSGDRTRKARRSAPPSSKPARSSAWCQVGSRAYATNTLESGWIPSPLPGDLHRRQAEGLSRVAAGERATKRTGSIGGSFVSDNIEDYYLTPYELGYGPFVKFDHDFIGRDALEEDGRQAASQEGDLRLEQRRREPRSVASMFAPRRRALQVHRPAAVQLRVVVVRQGDEQAARSSASRCSPATATTSARCCRSAASIGGHARSAPN